MDFEAVVVGSGFGGSVRRDRPRSPKELGENFWDPDKGLYRMFGIRNFSHLESLVSSCLGGGSIIYANVFIRKDEKWFVHESRLGTVGDGRGAAQLGATLG